MIKLSLLAVSEISPNFKNFVVPICRDASRPSKISRTDILIYAANHFMLLTKSCPVDALRAPDTSDLL